MGKWADLGTELENTLRLKTKVIAYRKLERSQDLDQIPGVRRIDRQITFCQVPFMARVAGLTIGITKDDSMGARCRRFCGLHEATESEMFQEAALLSTTWFHSPEDALEQQLDYPEMPAGEAIVLAPLIEEKFEPDVIMVYGNPAQIMMLLCGLQKRKYERFWFSFIGEGACSDSLARCYVTGKPALSIACYGERAIGDVADDEILVALPPGELERAVLGLKELADTTKRGPLRYPIRFIGAEHDPSLPLAELYPQQVVGEAIGNFLSTNPKLPKR